MSEVYITSMHLGNWIVLHETQTAGQGSGVRPLEADRLLGGGCG